MHLADDGQKEGARLKMERKMELELESRPSGTDVGTVCDNKLSSFRTPGQASGQELELEPGVTGDSRKTSGAPSWRARQTQAPPNNA